MRKSETQQIITFASVIHVFGSGELVRGLGYRCYRPQERERETKAGLFGEGGVIRILTYVSLQLDERHLIGM